MEGVLRYGSCISIKMPNFYSLIFELNSLTTNFSPLPMFWCFLFEDLLEATKLHINCTLFGVTILKQGH